MRISDDRHRKACFFDFLRKYEAGVNIYSSALHIFGDECVYILVMVIGMNSNEPYASQVVLGILDFPYFFIIIKHGSYAGAGEAFLFEFNSH